MLNKLILISRNIEKIVSFIGKIGSWLAIPLIFIIIFDIVTRRFLILGSTKLQEMEWHLHTALFLLVLGYAYLKNSHVRIEIVREKYSTLVKSIFETMGILIFLIPYILIKYQRNEMPFNITNIVKPKLIKIPNLCPKCHF